MVADRKGIEEEGTSGLLDELANTLKERNCREWSAILTHDPR
jgi:hypothetical protein